LSLAGPIFPYNHVVSAILLIGFNRPEFLERRIREIATNEPSNLYISIDGNRDKSVSRKIRSTIDSTIEETSLNSRVQIDFKKTNLGLSNHISQAVSHVLECEEKVVILEDDIRIGENFTKNIMNAYEQVSNCPSIGTIGGFSSIPGNFPLSGNYWRPTKYFSAWGWAINSQNWEMYRRHLPKLNIAKSLANSQTWKELSQHQKITWMSRFEKVADNPDLTWDYQMQYMTFKYDFTNLLPFKRICENEGFNDSRSTNTKSLRPMWMGSTVIDQSEFTARLNRQLSTYIDCHLDSFTISGDSKFRSRVNQIKSYINQKNE